MIKRTRYAVGVLVLGLFALLVMGCAVGNGQMNDAPAGQVRLVVTENYGTNVIIEKEIDVQPRMTVMDLLLAAGLEIETAYGGGYINGINGLKIDNGGSTGTRKDWFYYVNGIFADRGAADYELIPGETVWWDYHPWKMSTIGANAVIGCYPQPFVNSNGNQGINSQVHIYYCEGEKSTAEQIAHKLRSESNNEIIATPLAKADLYHREGPVMILGQWLYLNNCEYLCELNNSFSRNGMFLHFTTNSLELLNYEGKSVTEITENAGVIAASGEGFGEGNPLWLISGLDEAGYKAAVQVMLEYPERIKGKYQAAIIDGEIVNLPFQGD